MNLAPKEILSKITQNVSLEWKFNEELGIYVLVQNYSLKELSIFKNVQNLYKRYETIFECYGDYHRLVIEKIKIDGRIINIGFFSRFIGVHFNIIDRKNDKSTSHQHFSRKKVFVEKEQTCKLLLQKKFITQFKTAITKKDMYSAYNSFTNLYRGYGTFSPKDYKLSEMELKSTIEVDDFRDEFLNLFSLLNFNFKTLPTYLPSPLLIDEDDSVSSFPTAFADGINLKSKEVITESIKTYNFKKLFYTDHSITIKTDDSQIDLNSLFVNSSPFYDYKPEWFNLHLSNLYSTSIVLSYHFVELSISLDHTCFGKKRILRVAIPNNFTINIIPENSNPKMQPINVFNYYRSDREQLLYLAYYIIEFMLKDN